MREQLTARRAARGRRGAPPLRRVPARLLPLAALMLLLACAGARAADPYSETQRFGGFDAAYFNNGGYDGAGGPAAGRFLNPVGFAVDAADPTAPGQTAVYVLDRTSRQPWELGATRSRWRLQKLSESGQVLGVATFSLPGDQSFTFDAPPIGAIAVDSGSGGSPGRVYAVLQTLDTFEAIKVIAWSTEVTGGKLQSPAGLTADTYTQAEDGSQPAGVLSTGAQLNAGDPVLFPTAMAVAGTGTGRSLAIMHDSDTTHAEIVRVALEAGGGRAIGDKVETWQPSALAGLPNAPADIGSYQLDWGGLSRDADGGLTATLTNPALLFDAANVAVVSLDATLGNPRVLESWRNTPGQAASPAGGFLGRWAAISTPSAIYGLKPSAQVVELSDGRYGAVYSQWGGATPWGWQGSGTYAPMNAAVRLLAPLDAPGQPWDGTLSRPSVPVGSILNTIGSVSGTGACAIKATTADAHAGIAAGRDGSVWVLTVGNDAGAIQGAGRTPDGGQVIKLSPGTSGQPCPQPQGTFAATAGGRALDASAPITVPVGTRVDYDASQLRAGAWAFQYEWDLDGDAGNGYEQATTWTVDDITSAPPATATKTYTRAGTQTVRLRMHGDFGVITRELTVNVQSSEPPTAAFDASAGAAFVGDVVSFDASGSAPAPSTRLTNYHWEFGDGVVEDSQAPQIEHAFATAGTYPVRLTVRASNNQVSAAVTRTVTVTVREAPPRREPIRDPIREPVRDPPPADTIAPALSLRVAGASSAVVARIGCPATERSCSGTIALTAKTSVRVGRGRRAKTKTRTVTVGSASFTVDGGKTASVTVKLNGAGRALLRRARSLPVAVVVRATDAAGNGATKRASAKVARGRSRARAAR